MSVSAAAQAFTGTLNLSAKSVAVSRTLVMSHWQVDKRGVPSFDYRYQQSGPGCAYQRDGHAVAGFEDNGDSVELEVYNPQDAGGKAGAPITVFYDKNKPVIFSMALTKKKQGVWVSFEDATMKKTLPATCGFSGKGDAVIFTQ
jgi:hypothetical protein